MNFDDVVNKIKNKGKGVIIVADFMKEDRGSMMMLLSAIKYLGYKTPAPGTRIPVETCVLLIGPDWIDVIEVSMLVTLQDRMDPWPLIQIPALALIVVLQKIYEERAKDGRKADEFAEVMLKGDGIKPAHEAAVSEWLKSFEKP